jgi:uncharacterized membrane protein YdjX (TVP38/TMEM64 family)
MLKATLKYTLIVITFLTLIYAAYIGRPVFISLLATLQTLPALQLICCFSLIYILSNLFLVPIGLPLNLFAGVTWGIVGGGLIVNVLATFVAALSFLIARRFRPIWLDRFLAKKTFLNTLKNTINQYDWQFISMARINPVIPFSVSNYLFGLIPELSFKHYITATVLANLLPCFIFAAIGTMINSFYIEKGSQIHYIILETSIVLLLISILVTIKFVLPNKHNKYSLNKEII